MKPSGIGGMAVMEGVMMKNKDVYAVAVRKPNNEIVVEKNTHKDFSDKVTLFKLPIFRGILAFVDSLVVGMKVLSFSASFFDEEEEEPQKKTKNKKVDKKKESEIKNTIADGETQDLDPIDKEVKVDSIEEAAKKAKKDEANNTLLMVCAVCVSIVISITLFMVLPVILTNFLSSVVTNDYMNAFIEGIVRLVIFIGYILLASRMKEIKRVFMYHGAEHKTINCLENGFELTVENVKWQSKQHKRCGTSFMLLVMLISLVFFILIPIDGLVLRILSRILFVPFIAGISYEFIRLAGRSESKVVNILSQPGLWMQALTTKEPDDSMIEVAIQSVEAVFDWKTFLVEANKDKSIKNGKAAKPTATNSKQQSVTGNNSNNAKGSQNKKVTNVNKAAQTKKPSQETRSAEAAKTAEAAKVVEVLKAVEKVKIVEAAKTIEATKTSQTMKADQQVKSAAAMKAAQTAKQEQAAKAAKAARAVETYESAREEKDAASKVSAAKATEDAKTAAIKVTEAVKAPVKEAVAAANKAKASYSEEEDDEILRALDKFFDAEDKEFDSSFDDN